MPLVAFHCPEQSWNWKKIGDCRECDHVCFGSLEWVEVVWAETFGDSDHYHSNPMVISVTETLGCLRQAWYKRKNDYAESPHALLARVQGTNMHRLVEKHCPDGAEHTMFTPLSRGYSLGGTVDKMKPGLIKDWKSCDKPTKGIGGGMRTNEDGSKVHVNCEQVSIYADLQQMDDDARLEIVQVGRRDIKAHEAYRVPDALFTAIERAELLIDALESEKDFLPREGGDIKYWQATQCSFCVFKDECLTE